MTKNHSNLFCRFILAAAVCSAISISCQPILAQDFGQLETAIAPFDARPVADELNGFVNVPTAVPQTETEIDQWWGKRVGEQMERSSHAVPVTLEQLLVSALKNSKQVRVFSDLPLIRRTAIMEAYAAFDWSGYLDTKWNDTNEPVGNTLTTGGPPRLESHKWTGEAGVRRRNQTGGFLDISQGIGTEDSNSVFFLPNNQGTARLSLSYTHPLMKGRGKVYNTSLIVLAQIDANIAKDEFMRQLQSHLLEITRSYWSLYLERASLLQKEKLYRRAAETLKEIEGRRGVDAVDSQIARVRAAVSERRAQLIRAQTAVRNAQERIMALVNDPEMANISAAELIPADKPTSAKVPVVMRDAVSTALRSRPEIGQALKQVRASCVRLGMSKNELLPQLDLILESYLAGLRAERGVGSAWNDQFREGEPSYSVGLHYEIPIGNRAAKARMERRRLEVRQLKNQFDSTVETLLLEVKTSVREVNTSYREMFAKYESMQAAAQQLEYIQQRWKRLAGEEKTATLYLEDLLNAQQQLATAEFGYLQSNTVYNLSLMNLKRSQGTLLNDEGVMAGEGLEDSLPTIYLDKAQHQSVIAPGHLGH